MASTLHSCGCHPSILNIRPQSTANAALRIQSLSLHPKLRQNFASKRIPEPRTSNKKISTGRSGVCFMGIKAVESYDSTLDLQEENEKTLVALLSSETFCQQVAAQPGIPQNAKFEFSGKLFQPVPWSPTTKHGMPQEFEEYYKDKENYVFINVPPNFMFNAKIFKPSRLCAIYQRVDVEEAS